MEMKLMGWSLIVFGLVVMVLNNACPANGITCQEALMTLMPCEPYLVGSGPGSPAVPCCAGVQTLVSEATSTEIRRNLCECLKTAAAGMKIDPARLNAIPEYCKSSSVLKGVHDNDIPPYLVETLCCKTGEDDHAEELH
ncbi:hypothetical protein ACE6H2_014950 [Prunus campanulata]